MQYVNLFSAVCAYTYHKNIFNLDTGVTIFGILKFFLLYLVISQENKEWLWLLNKIFE